MPEQKLIALDLSILAEEVIEILLLDTSAEPSLFDEIAKKNTHRPNVLFFLMNHPRTPIETKHFVAQKLQTPVPVTVSSKESADNFQTEGLREQKTQTLLQRIQKLKVGEKIQLALRGSKEIRSILFRDANKEVMLTVLKNPKLTESEVEIISKQKSTPEDLIRSVAKKREWIKKYSIVLALVSNPKTPIVISLKYVKNLRTKDLGLIEKDKNIPNSLRMAAKRIVSIRKKA
jgi:hypothetical protein